MSQHKRTLILNLGRSRTNGKQKKSGNNEKRTKNNGKREKLFNGKILFNGVFLLVLQMLFVFEKKGNKKVNEKISSH